jgi:hypothetical protein
MPTLLANSGSRLQIVPNGLKAHYDATSFNGIGAWVDLTGNNLSGSILGTTKYAPYNGGCLSFDGSASYVQTPKMPLSGSATDPWTMGIWVAPSASAGNIISMSSVAPSGSWNMPPISSSGGKFLAKVWQGNAAAVNQLTSSAYTTGSWYYLTLVWDQINAAQYFYVNGALVGSQSSVVYGSSGVDNFLYLGQANPGADNTGSFRGYMGNFHYYNRALSSTEISQNYKALSSRYAVPIPLPALPTTGLQLYLDATNTSSYPGSGTLWSDLSGNGYNFNVSASAFNAGGKYMDFSGSYGIAKRVVGGVLTDVPNAATGTFIIWSSLLNSTTNWRTLIRGALSDHQVIIESGANRLGLYDNDFSGFIPSGVDVTSLTTPYNNHLWWWQLSQSSPQYSFGHDKDVLPRATISNSNATFNSGFCCIGGYHNGSTDASSAANSSQYWGNIKAVAYYNRALSSEELSTVYSFFNQGGY